jgi:hypothetical protein
MKTGLRSDDPEKCAVLISITYAQAQLKRSAEARQTLAQFDRDCKGVRYLDWFPGEAERVHRLVSLL